jgi:S1-C subfamily serine protease
MQKDLAILYTPSLPPVDALQIQEHPPAPPQLVYVIGFPLGWSYSIRMEGKLLTGRTGIAGKPYMLTTAPIAHGVSGSPILDTEDKVVGVVQIGIDCAMFCDVSGGSPWEETRAFAEPYWEK